MQSRGRESDPWSRKIPRARGQLEPERCKQRGPLLAADGESLHGAMKSQRGREEQEIKKKQKNNLFVPHCTSEYIIALRSNHSSEAGMMVLIDEEAEAPKSNFLRVLEQASGRTAANSDPRAHFYPLLSGGGKGGPVESALVKNMSAKS